MESDKVVREQLLFLLRGGNAHMNFDQAVADFQSRISTPNRPTFHIPPGTCWNTCALPSGTFSNSCGIPNTYLPPGRRVIGRQKTKRRIRLNGRKLLVTSIPTWRRCRIWSSTRKSTCMRPYRMLQITLFYVKSCLSLTTTPITSGNSQYSGR